MNVGNALFMGWNHPLPGREKRALEHFVEFHVWLDEQKAQGKITGYQDVILNPHGGDLNGFILITGDAAKLAELIRSDGWVNHLIRATLNVRGVGTMSATTGDAVPALMQAWARHV
jgi:hypothetical protein